MLDTEQKVDKFLSDLKEQLMSSMMEANMSGATVKIKDIKEGIYYDNEFNLGGVTRIISISMNIKPESYAVVNYIDSQTIEALDGMLPLHIKL